MTSVSIILPTRDRPNWLPRAVASVLHQTDWQWQLVVLDNSTEPYYRHSPWFDHRIVYSHQRCDGIADAYSKALALATGDVIVPLADDDTLAFTCVERARQMFANPDVLWTNARTQIVNERGDVTAIRGGDQESVDRTRAGSYWLGGAVWWRRELTAERAFDPRYEGAADFDLYLRFLERCDPVLVDEVMYVYQDWEGTDSRLHAGRQQTQSAAIAHQWRNRHAVAS